LFFYNLCIAGFRSTAKDSIMPYSKPWPLAAMQTSIVGKRSVNAQQLTGIDAIKSVEIDCAKATISNHVEHSI
jgi:hypothetical protein